MPKVEAIKVVVPMLKIGKNLYRKGTVFIRDEITQDLRSEYASGSGTLEEVVAPPEVLETNPVVTTPEDVEADNKEDGNEVETTGELTTTGKGKRGRPKKNVEKVTTDDTPPVPNENDINDIIGVNGNEEETIEV